MKSYLNIIQNKFHNEEFTMDDAMTYLRSLGMRAIPTRMEMAKSLRCSVEFEKIGYQIVKTRRGAYMAALFTTRE